MGIDLEREGISIVAIHGTHFTPFARLFSAEGLPKKCAIVGDADNDLDDDEIDNPEVDNYAVLENQYVRSFLGPTTFERELTVSGNLDMLAKTAEDLKAPRCKQ